MTVRHKRPSIRISAWLFCSIAIATVGSTTGFAQDGQAVESLLLRGIPVESDPQALLRDLKASQALPFRPVDQVPLYGLPHGLIQTSAGRFAFRMDDLSLPGKVPIDMGRIHDSGVSMSLPPPPPGSTEEPRFTRDLGEGWLLAYSDYIVLAANEHFLVGSDGSITKWVPVSQGSSVYRKHREHPSNHLKLTKIDALTFEEERADGSIWRYEWNTVMLVWQLAKITERHGQTLTVTLQSGYLQKVENSEGYWVEIDRPLFEVPPGTPPYPNYRITGMTDSTGRSVSFDYDSSGLLTSWTDANGKTWDFEYHGSDKLHKIKNPLDEEILTASYDAQHRITSLALGAGATTVSYNTAINRTTVTDPNGNATWYDYNNGGITTQVGLADGSTASIALDMDGNIINFTDTEGDLYTFTWDSEHRLTSYTAPSTESPPLKWDYTYDGSGNLINVLNPKGTATLFGYNSEGDITFEGLDGDDDGTAERSWTASYDTAGNLLSLTDYQSNVTKFGYNSQNLRTSITLPAPGVPVDSHVTDLEYDSAGRLTKIKRPLTASTKAEWVMAYDGRGFTTSVTNPESEVTTYIRDDAGRLTEIKDGLNNSRTFAYDAASRLTSETDRVGSVTTYAYDTGDNLTTLTDALGNDWTFTYDVMNRIAAMSDPLARQWQLTWWSHGGIKDKTFPSGQKVSHSYDEQNRLTGRDYPDGSSDEISYDRNGNLAEVRHMNADGTLSVTYTNGEYDEIERIDMQLLDSDGTTQFSNYIDYTYDTLGRRLSAGNADDDVDYAYNPLGQLTSVSSLAGARGYTSMTYDPWKLQRTVLDLGRANKKTEYTTDDAGRIATYDLHEDGTLQETHTLVRNAAGWVSQDTVSVPGQSDRVVSYTRDAKGRITEIEHGNGEIETFVYDALDHVLSYQKHFSDKEPFRYAAAFNESGEPLWATDGNQLAYYIFDHLPADTSTALSVQRDTVFHGGGTHQVEFGYDERIARTLAFNESTSQFDLTNEYLWLPQELGQIAQYRWLDPVSSWRERSYLHDFAGPWAFYDSSGTSLYPVDSTADTLPRLGLFQHIATRTSSSREQFPHFGRRLDGDLKSSLDSSVALTFGASQASALDDAISLARVFGRSDESPPYAQEVDSLQALPSSGGFDGLLGGDLLPGGVNAEFRRGAVGAPSNGDRRPGVQGRGKQLCGGDSHWDRGGCHLLGNCNGFDGDSGGGTGATSSGNDCLDADVLIPPWCRLDEEGFSPCVAPDPPEPPPCTTGLRTAFRNNPDDQEPYRNGADDPYGVTLSSGEYMLSVTELSLPGRGPSLSFTRTYRSRVRLDSPVGYGWNHNFRERIEAGDVSCNTIHWMKGDMWSGTFAWDPVKGLYVGPPGTYMRLIRDTNPDGYRLRTPEGTIRWFGDNGRLERVEDRYGNGLFLEYGNTAKQMVREATLIGEYADANQDGTISDTEKTARSLSLSYAINSAEGSNPWRLTQVTDHAGRMVRFNHDEYGDLVAVTSPATSGEPLGDDLPLGRQIQYRYTQTGDFDGTTVAYNDPLAHNLKEVRAPIDLSASGSDDDNDGTIDGTAYLRISYDPTNDRVQKIAYGGQPADTDFFKTGNCAGGTCVTYTYVEVAGDDGPLVTKTTFKDRLNNETEYDFEASTQRLTQRTVKADGTKGRNATLDCDGDGTTQAEADWVTTYNYNSDGELDNTQLPEGGELIRTYGTRGEILREETKPGPRGDGSGNGTQNSIVREFTYEPVFNRVRSSTAPNGEVTTFYYDYMEGDGSQEEFQDYLSEWSIDGSLDLSEGDLNEDGIVGRWRGSLVKRVSPQVTDADGTMSIYEWKYQTNVRGQVTWQKDPTNAITHSLFYGADDDADGTKDTWEGYLKTQFAYTYDYDEDGSLDEVKTQYEYDSQGNTSAVVDPRGTRTEYLYNTVNQLKRVIRDADNDGDGTLNTLNFKTLYKHDDSGNVIERHVQKDPLDDAVQNPAITKWEYDTLDQRVAQEVHLDDSGSDIAKTLYCYDANQNLTKTISPEGRVTVFAYDERDLRWQSTRYMNQVARPNDLTLPSSCTSLPTVDPNDDVTTERVHDGRGNVTESWTMVAGASDLKSCSEYDGFDRAIRGVRWVDSSGETIEVRTEFDLSGNILETEIEGATDETGSTMGILQRTVFEPDELNRIRKTWQIFDQDGTLEETTCSGKGTSCAFLTKTIYDGMGRVTQRIDPLGNTLTTEYDELGRRRRTVDALPSADANTVEFFYDQGGNLLKTQSIEQSEESGVSGDTFEVAHTYDALGRVRYTIQDPDGTLALTTEFKYDARDLLIETIDPMGHASKRFYDAAGRLEWTESPGAQHATYDPDGLIREEFDYDRDFLLEERRDDAGSATRHWYDGVGRAIGLRYPDGSGRKTEYDQASRAKTVELKKIMGANPSTEVSCQDSSNECFTISQLFDDLGRIESRSVVHNNPPGNTHFRGSMSQSFAYDGLSRLRLSIDFNGDGGTTGPNTAIVTVDYDTLSRLTSENQRVGEWSSTPIEKSVAFRYDSASRRDRITYPSGKPYDLVRDELGRLKEIQHNSNSLVSYNFLGQSLVLKRKYDLPGSTPNISKRYFEGSTHLYDRARRPTKLRHKKQNNSPFLEYEFVYDDDGKRLREKHLHETPVAGTWTGNKWSYDDAERVSTARYGEFDSNDNPVGTTDRNTYTFDGLGNWREHSVEADGTTNTYQQTLVSGGQLGDGLNQYEKWQQTPGTPPSGGTDIEYDFLGNITRATLELQGVPKTLKFYYDFQSRLVDVEHDGTIIESYTYDAGNRRVSRTSGQSSPVFFFYDGWRVVEEYIGNATNPDQRYVWGREMDELVIQERHLGSGTYETYFMSEDFLGSIVEVRADDSSQVATLRYGPFGKVEASTGTINLFPYRYTGQRFDEQTGLHYYKNRYFSAELGRFLQRDPVGDLDGPNLYAYVGNGSPNMIDPIGLLAKGSSAGIPAMMSRAAMWASIHGDPMGIVADQLADSEEFDEWSALTRDGDTDGDGELSEDEERAVRTRQRAKELYGTTEAPTIKVYVEWGTLADSDGDSQTEREDKEEAREIATKEITESFGRVGFDVEIVDGLKPGEGDYERGEAGLYFSAGDERAPGKHPYGINQGRMSIVLAGAVRKDLSTGGATNLLFATAIGRIGAHEVAHAMGLEHTKKMGLMFDEYRPAAQWARRPYGELLLYAGQGKTIYNENFK